jgi:hypothetical protein
MPIKPEMRVAIADALTGAKFRLLGPPAGGNPGEPVPLPPGHDPTAPNAGLPPVVGSSKEGKPKKKKKKGKKHHVRGGKPWPAGSWPQGDWVWSFLDNGLYAKEWGPDPEIDYSRTDEDVPFYETGDPGIDRWSDDEVWDAMIRTAREEALRIGLEPHEFWKIIRGYMKERGLHLAPWERQKRRWPGG